MIFWIFATVSFGGDVGVMNLHVLCLFCIGVEMRGEGLCVRIIGIWGVWRATIPYRPVVYGRRF